MVKDIEEWRMTTIHKFSFVLPSFGESLSNLSLILGTAQREPGQYYHSIFFST